MQRQPILALLLGSAILASPMAKAAQQPTPTKSFEVASVRIATSGGMSVFPNFPSPTLRMENMPMTVLIAMAYGMSDDRLLNGPSWLRETLYSLQAKPEGDTPLTEEQYQPLLQDLLRKRFHLAVHREARQVSGYELVLAKGGPKLTPAPTTDAMCYILANGLDSESATSGTIASLLARPVGHPVVDKTGLRLVQAQAALRRTRGHVDRSARHLHRSPGAARSKAGVPQGARRLPRHRPRG